MNTRRNKRNNSNNVSERNVKPCNSRPVVPPLVLPVQSDHQQIPTVRLSTRRLQAQSSDDQQQIPTVRMNRRSPVQSPVQSRNPSPVGRNADVDENEDDNVRVNSLIGITHIVKDINASFVPGYRLIVCILYYMFICLFLLIFILLIHVFLKLYYD